jgi:hypothetical protein
MTIFVRVADPWVGFEHRTSQMRVRHVTAVQTSSVFSIHPDGVTSFKKKLRFVLLFELAWKDEQEFGMNRSWLN